MKLVVFTEEESMKVTLQILLPKIGVSIDDVLILSHQGKSDLERSWRLKLRSWSDPNTNFLILRDADGADCLARKAELTKVAAECGKEARATVRIVCQELEAWFLGDPEALRNADYGLPQANPAQLREPDSHLKPSEILSRWKPGRQKVSGAREIATYMDPTINTSPSFYHAMKSIKEITG